MAKREDHQHQGTSGEEPFSSRRLEDSARRVIDSEGNPFINLRRIWLIPYSASFGMLLA
jgi:hypothetical protein